MTDDTAKRIAEIRARDTYTDDWGGIPSTAEKDRKFMLAELDEALGLLEKTEPHLQRGYGPSMAHCERYRQFLRKHGKGK